MKNPILTFSLAAMAFGAGAVETYPLPEGVLSVSPAQGRVDTGNNANPLGLQVITVNFDAELTVNQDSDATACIYLDGDDQPFSSAGAEGVSVDAMYPVTGAVSFPRSIKGDGDYYVYIPEGMWLVGTDLTPSPALRLGYTIATPQTICPAPGMVDDLYVFTLEFPGADRVTYNPSVSLDFYGVGSALPYSVEVSMPQGDQNQVTLTVAEGPVTSPGTYGMLIPAGAFTAETDAADGSVSTIANIELIYRWTIAPFPTPDIDPAPGAVSEFGSFTLTPPEGFSLMMVNDRGSSYLYPVDQEGNTLPDAVAIYKASRLGEQVVLGRLDDDYMPTDEPFVPEQGQYRLVLGGELFSGFYNDNFVNSVAFEYEYTLLSESGARRIADRLPETFEVFTATGLRVGQGMTDAELHALPAGLYIAGGRKVLVR